MKNKYSYRVGSSECFLCHTPFDMGHSCMNGREIPTRKKVIKPGVSFEHGIGHMEIIPHEAFEWVSLIGYQEGKPVVRHKNGELEVIISEEFLT